MDEREIILFDWDDTLFSKTEYKNNLRTNLARICKTSEDEVWAVDEEYFKSLEKSDDFMIESFVRAYEEKFKVKIDLEDFTTDKLGIYSTALFPDTKKVLEDLQKRFILGIYSQGYPSLQNIKIDSSGIRNYFDGRHIYINRNKLDPAFIAQLPDSIIIDDKKEVVTRVGESDRFNVFWLDRKGDSEKINGVMRVRTLPEFEKKVA